MLIRGAGRDGAAAEVERPGDELGGGAGEGAVPVQAEGSGSILLWFADLKGQLESFAICTSELAGVLDDGNGVDGSS